VTWNENIEDETGRSHMYLVYVQRPGGGTEVFSQRASKHFNRSSIDRALNAAASTVGFDPRNAVVSSVSYLGHMTREEWEAP